MDDEEETDKTADVLSTILLGSCLGYLTNTFIHNKIAVSSAVVLGDFE